MLSQLQELLECASIFVIIPFHRAGCNDIEPDSDKTPQQTSTTTTTTKATTPTAAASGFCWTSKKPNTICRGSHLINAKVPGATCKEKCEQYPSQKCKAYFIIRDDNNKCKTRLHKDL